MKSLMFFGLLFLFLNVYFVSAGDVLTSFVVKELDEDEGVSVKQLSTEDCVKACELEEDVSACKVEICGVELGFVEQIGYSFKSFFRWLFG